MTFFRAHVSLYSTECVPMPAMSALQVNSFAYTSSIANVAAVTMDGGFFQRWAEMRRIFFTLCASGGPPAYNLRQASFCGKTRPFKF